MLVQIYLTEKQETATIMNFRNTIFLLLFVAATTSAYSRGSRPHSNDVESDPDMEKYLREALENFREQMKEGIDAINMPRLDPLELRNLDLNINENLASLSLRVKQVTVNNLSSFNITDLQSNLEKLYLSISLRLPALYVKGYYDLDGKFVKIFPIYGSGDFEINATDIILAGKGQLRIANESMEMDMIKLDLQWKQITVFLENFLKGGDFSDVVQRIIPGVGKDVFLAYKPFILDKIESALTRKVNDKLDDPLVKEIIKGIHPDD